MKRRYCLSLLVVLCLGTMWGCPAQQQPQGGDAEHAVAGQIDASSAVAKANPPGGDQPDGQVNDAQRRETDDTPPRQELAPVDTLALSVISAEHFAAVKVDAEKIRNDPLVKKFAGNFESSLSEFARQATPVDLSEIIPQVNTLLVAFAPGPGNWEDLFGREVERENPPVANEFERGDDLENTLELNPPELRQVLPPAHACVFIYFQTPAAIDNVRAMLGPDATPIEYQHGEYVEVQGDFAPFWLAFGRQHLVLASQEKFIQSALARRGVPADVPLVREVRRVSQQAELTAAAIVDPIRGKLAQALQRGEGLPAKVRAHADIFVRKVDRFALAVDLTSSTFVDLKLEALDRQAAEAIRDTVRGLQGLGSILLSGQINEAKEAGVPAAEIDLLRFMQRLIGRVLVQQDGQRLEVSLARPDDWEETLGAALPR